MESLTADQLYNKAVDLVIAARFASTSFLARELNIEYDKAVTIMTQLVADQIVSGPDALGKRTILKQQGF